jgi:tetratricopeptide (TPR) repeat protein
MSTLSWHDQGVAATVERRFADALELFQKALAEEPDVGIHYSEAALCLLALRQRDEALAMAQQGATLSPNDRRCRAYLATTLVEFGRTDEAQALFQAIIAENPDYAPIYCRYGQALTMMGRLDEAEQAVRRGIELDPTESRNYYQLVRLTQLAEDDPCLRKLEALSTTFDTFPDNRRVDFHFALGQALYQLGDQERSFEHLQRANAIRHHQVPFVDHHVVRSIMTNVEMVDPAAIAKRSEQGYLSDAPIFIVSMPRSGSTLVEQMLASHPDVVGLEEHASFEKARWLVGGFPLHNAYAGADEAQWVADKLMALGEQYVKTVYTDYPAAREHRHFTDKTIDNYQHVGLMHLALPQARFIQIQRSILDTCLSIFTNQFAGLNYSYDLYEIGKYYQLYDYAMQHWAQVLPAGLILDVQYEQLVTNFEAEARRIVEHCGLPWDARCLSFHTTERVVRTASNIQVRQPVYRSSLKRWRPTDTQLQPLYEGLGPRLAALAKEQDEA